MVKTVVRELVDLEDPAVNGALELYISSFPEEEREPLETVRERIARRGHTGHSSLPAKRFLVAETNHEVVGLSIHDYFPGTGLAWLVYLAVSPTARRKGIGSLLLECALEQCRLEATFANEGLRGVILEVERPQDFLNEHDWLVRTQRLAFFYRHQVVKLSDTYVQPALRKGLPTVPLSLFLAGAPAPPTTMERRELVSDFMVKLWKLAPDDPLTIQSLIGVEPSSC